MCSDRLDYHRRSKIGNVMETVIARFFTHYGLTVIRIADSVKNVIEQHADRKIGKIWKSDAVKSSNTILMLRYMPDFLVISTNQNTNFNAVMIDVKTMFTPVYLNTFRKQLEQEHGRSIPVENIGNIEREAFESYQSYQRGGAKVAVLTVCSYAKELVSCEFVENIKEIHKDSGGRNALSAGSTTPRVNVDMDSFRSIKKFLFDVFSIDVTDEDINKLHVYARKKLDFVACPESLIQTKVNEETVHNVLAHLSSVTGYPLNLRIYGSPR